MCSYLSTMYSAKTVATSVVHYLSFARIGDEIFAPSENQKNTVCCMGSLDRL